MQPMSYLQRESPRPMPCSFQLSELLWVTKSCPMVLSSFSLIPAPESSTTMQRYPSKSSTCRIMMPSLVNFRLLEMKLITICFIRLGSLYMIGIMDLFFRSNQQFFSCNFILKVFLTSWKMSLMIMFFFRSLNYSFSNRLQSRKSLSR